MKLVDIERAVLISEQTLMAVESHVAVMRMHLATCDWAGASRKATDAAAAFEAHLDAIQEMYRTMARC